MKIDKIEITPLKLAQRFGGIKEVAGTMSNPQILSMLQLDQDWPEDDSVPWCSAFVNYIAFLLDLNRTRSLRARSWLLEKIVTQSDATPGFDIVILKRGKGLQPGADIIDAPGHVSFFTGYRGAYVRVWGGNQNDTVKESLYLKKRILGIRRLTRK